jgi:hypothetical protein
MITEYELKNAKPQSKDYTISADSGLFVLVKSTGSKLWRFKYSFGGKIPMSQIEPSMLFNLIETIQENGLI